MAKLTCTKCGKEKPRDSFYNRSDGKGKGVQSHCKRCVIEKQKSLYTADEIKLKNKRNNLKKKYGLTLEEYYKLLDDAEHSCEICGRSDKQLGVDHCHKTGRIRGVLCFHCNAGLGHYKENPNLLDNAKRYLAR